MGTPAQAGGKTRLGLFTDRELATVSGRLTSCTYSVPLLNFAKSRYGTRTHVAHSLPHPFQMARAEHLMSVSGDENQDEMAVLPACLSRYLTL